MKSVRPSTRLASLLLGLLYLLAWGEPVAWHPCPMHDGITVPAASAAHGPAASAQAAGGHAHDAAAAEHGLQAAAPAPDGGHDDHACQCLGHGCCPGGVLVPTVQAVRWRVVIARRAEPPAPAAAITRAAAPRLLPFANGPPGLA
ncbi:MAG: hypothetical protein ACXW0Z_18230 [Gemmatirosa sp.]